MKILGYDLKSTSDYIFYQMGNIKNEDIIEQPDKDVITSIATGFLKNIQSRFVERDDYMYVDVTGDMLGWMEDISYNVAYSSIIQTIQFAFEK